MPEREQAALQPLLEALGALHELGIADKTLMKAMVSNDPAALDTVNKAITASGNKDAIIEKMRKATELMQAAVTEMSGRGVEAIVDEIEQELTALGEPQVETAATVAVPLEPIELHEDTAALATEQAERQAAAISELTRAEQSPAAEHGAPIKGVAAFDLLCVTGSDAESINTYLAEQARKLGRKDIAELTREEFQQITADTDSFHKWSAQYWVANFIAERKQVTRDIAKGKTDSVYHRGGRYSSGRTSEPTKEHVLAEPYREKRQEYNSVQRALDEFERSQQRRITESAQALTSQHAVMLTAYEQSLRDQGMSGDIIVRLLDQQRQVYEQARVAIQAEKQTGLDAELDARRGAVAQHKQQLEELEKATVHTVAAGTKREMVLSVDRWGKVLQQAAADNPNLMQRDQVTKQITINIDAVRRDPKVREILIGQIGKEIQRVTAAQSSRTETSLRANNLEAIITGPAEAELVQLYLKELLRNVTNTRSPRDRESLLIQHDIVWKFLNEKKLASVEHELEALAVYKSMNRELPSALPSLVEQYKKDLEAGRDNLRYSDIPEKVARQVSKLLEERVTNADGNKLLGPGFLDGLYDLAELIGNKNIVKYPYNQWLFGRMLSTFGTWCGRNVDSMKRAVYQAATKNGHVLWSNAERYVQADIVLGDFAGRHNELSSYDQDMVSNAAFTQIELNVRDWAKTNRSEACAWLDRVAAVVQRRFAERMPDITSYSSGVSVTSINPAKAVVDWKERAEQVQAIVKAMEVRLSKVAQLKAEL